MQQSVAIETMVRLQVFRNAKYHMSGHWAISPFQTLKSFQFISKVNGFNARVPPNPKVNRLESKDSWIINSQSQTRFKPPRVSYQASLPFRKNFRRCGPSLWECMNGVSGGIWTGNRNWGHYKMGDLGSPMNTPRFPLSSKIDLSLRDTAANNHRRGLSFSVAKVLGIWLLAT